MNPFIHKHWTIYAYDKINEAGAYEQPVAMSIQDVESEEEAIKKAEKIVRRKLYVLREVRECSVCGTLDQNATAVLKIAKNSE